MNNKWIIFSYSVPATQNSERVRFWRRVSAIGAIQLKNSLYILPNLAHLHEQVMWLIKEVETSGGEAAMFIVGEVANTSQAELQQLFTTQRDADYVVLHDSVTETAESFAATPPMAKELRFVLKKFRKKIEAIREIDYFPSGEYNVVRTALDALTDKTLIPSIPTENLPELDREDFQSRVWVTREKPYIDRVATYWLIVRHVDKDAQIRFLAPGEEPLEGEIPFDMSTGIFSHHGTLITFEVMARCFNITHNAIAGLIDIVRPIDLQEDAVLPDDATLFKRILDGNIAIAPDDHTLMQIMLQLFDAFEASYAEAT